MCPPFTRSWIALACKNARVQAYDQIHNSNEVLIALDIQETSEQALDKGKTQIIQALESSASSAKPDLNNASSLTILKHLLDKDPPAPQFRG